MIRSGCPCDADGAVPALLFPSNQPCLAAHARKIKPPFVVVQLDTVSHHQPWRRIHVILSFIHSFKGISTIPMGHTPPSRSQLLPILTFLDGNTTTGNNTCILWTRCAWLQAIPVQLLYGVYHCSQWQSTVKIWCNHTQPAQNCYLISAHSSSLSLGWGSIVKLKL